MQLLLECFDNGIVCYAEQNYHNFPVLKAFIHLFKKKTSPMN